MLEGTIVTIRITREGTTPEQKAALIKGRRTC
jgi:phenylpyruvate tautomerase PptA (4-oxalocrotonate tautomerase family)